MYLLDTVINCFTNFEVKIFNLWPTVPLLDNDNKQLIIHHFTALLHFQFFLNIQIKNILSKMRGIILFSFNIYSLRFDFTGETEKYGHLSLRVALGIIAMCSVVISTTYSGNLIASLTGNVKPFENQCI